MPMNRLAPGRHDGARAVLVRLALIAALAMAAFAHRPAAATPTGMSALEMAHYVLPDGSMPVRCLPEDDGGISGNLCEFCLIAGGAAVPGPGNCLPAMRLRAETGSPLVTRTGPPIAAAHLETAPVRGPPPAG